MDNVVFTQQQRVLSFCSGYGGIERGINAVSDNLKTVCYVEIEAFAIQNLLKIMEAGVLDSAPIWSNVKTFPSRQFRNKIHGITGGYPCQPFSHAGARRGHEDPRHLWPYIRRAVEAIRPVWCFFENVEGHLELGFNEVYKSLVDLGYRVEGGIFSATEVGAPHQRKRLFILAVDDAESIPGGLPICKSEKGVEFIGAGKTMGDTESERECGDWGISGRPKIKTRGSNHEVADTECERYRDPTNRQSLSQQDRVYLDKKKDGAGIRSKFDRRGKLADAEGDGMEGDGAEGEQIANTSLGKRLPRCDCGGIWPARPGPYQYDWGYERAIEKAAEPRMGLTINGYAFRNDLLRLLGNGVVPQTAAKAWVTLWNKILQKWT